MKNTILAVCASALVLSTSVNAGVNGTYTVTGSETEDGEKYRFSGTVTVSNYRAGTYALNFGKGGRSTFKFNFSTPLKETTSSQTVRAYNDLGTSTATFYQKKGKLRVEFTYKSKDGSVRGSGSGSK